MALFAWFWKCMLLVLFSDTTILDKLRLIYFPSCSHNIAKLHMRLTLGMRIIHPRVMIQHVVILRNDNSSLSVAARSPYNMKALSLEWAREH